ncbi:MAG: hypothetical protein WBG50_10025 [Desulfomonilaceae bacterium]
MTDEKILATLILDKDMVVTDKPCTGATLIAQFPEGYFALTVTDSGKCAFGFEGAPTVSIGVRDLLDLVKVKGDPMLH